MKKRFDKNGLKQRKLYDLLAASFNYELLENCEKSLVFYFEQIKNEEIEKTRKILSQIMDGIISFSEVNTKMSKQEFDNKNIDIERDITQQYKKDLQKNLVDLQILFFNKLSMNWEKFILSLLELCNIQCKNKGANNYGLSVAPLLKKNFTEYANSKLSAIVDNIRKISNELKHKNVDNYSIINESIEKIINIQCEIYENKNGFIRYWPTMQNLEEEDKIDFTNAVKKIDEFKENLCKNKLVDLSYIIKEFKILIQDWIHREFSFSEQKMHTIVVNSTSRTYIIFSEQEKRELEEYKKNFTKKARYLI